MARTEGYVHVGTPQALPQEQPAAEADGVAVALRLERIAEELAAAQPASAAKGAAPAAPAPNAVGVGLKGVQDNAPGFSVRIGIGRASVAEPVPEDAPCVIVAALGKTAKALLPVFSQAGLRTVVPVTDDRKMDTAPKLAHGTVSVGAVARPGTIHNACALLKGAADADACALFLCDTATPLAQDDRFLARAVARGLRVFVPASDAIALGWTECTADPSASYGDEDWRTCRACGLAFEAPVLAENGHACPACGALARMTSDERIATVLDPGSFDEWDEPFDDADPLGFEGYLDKLADNRRKSGYKEAVRIGQGAIGGIPCACGFMDSTFLMGSMGAVVGEKVSRLFDRATAEQLPVVLFTASGGARMQEGLVSLMQMAKTSCAVERHGNAGLLYLSVITDPTTGGVTASFATEADIILSEPGTLIGFAGQRVIRDTIKQELPEGFQTAEFALEHGLIDVVVPREHLREALGRLLALHTPLDGDSEASKAAFLGPFGAQAMADGPLNSVTVSNIAAARERRLDFAAKIPLVSKIIKPADPVRQLERHAERELRRSGAPSESTPGSAWASVQLARNVHRPTAQCYIADFADGFFELHGDRAFGDDAAIMAGIAWVDGVACTVIGQEKGADLNERIRRNFGCPQPEGYRKAMRLMRQAEKFGRPILCIVDTQGAFCGTEAEERGQGNAIAESLVTMAGLHVPCISVLIGEGGSGGALALALANRVAMQEHAVYSVLSPEGFASILWKDGKRAPEAAETMRMNAAEVHAMGIVDEVLPEGEGGAHQNPDQAFQGVREYLARTLAELSALSGMELKQQRQARFAKF